MRRRISAELLATSPEISSPMSRSKRRPDVSSCECQNNYFAELNLFPHRLYIFQVQLISCTSVEGHDFATQGKMHQMQSEQIVFSRLFCTRISRKRKMNLYLAMNFGRFCTYTLLYRTLANLIRCRYVMVPSFVTRRGRQHWKNLYTWYFVIILRRYTFERLGGM